MVALAHRGEKQGEHNTMVYRGVSMPIGRAHRGAHIHTNLRERPNTLVDVNV